ncbi:MAG: putative metalloprotease with PDZ domain [Verrucomicrobiales bacterium]|jgi:predicted metalloprotease with PDZ domain
MSLLMSRSLKLRIVYAVTIFVVSVFHSRAGAEPMQITIDATDLPRKLLRSTITIPIKDISRKDGEIALWYPKWVPGSHGPGGPIANVAGMQVLDRDGNQLKWRRTVGEVHRVIVDIPEHTDTLLVKVRYITNQPTLSSTGHDSFGSALLGIISPSSVFFYPEGIEIDEMQIETTLLLPKAWNAATALPRSTRENPAEADDDKRGISYETASVRTYIDSPIMCGRHHRTYQLAEESHIPPHRLHIFSEAESALEVHPKILERLRGMVTQTARLFGSHPFDQFDILLATTDVLPKNGLEHSRSTFNVLGQRAYMDPDTLKGWDRLLVPHEYIHTWCGKFRRPAGMVTSNYHSDKSTELLWVYEGLTQYLGEVIEARAGWMNEEEFKHRFEIEIRAAVHQQGRAWRSLVDTGACSHLLRGRSKFWSQLRRSQDYYMEGMLFWFEVDAVIRDKTSGEKSLDDFCATFFAFSEDSPHPSGFTRADIVESLGDVVEYDWDGLIARRVEALVDQFDTAVVNAVGYSIQFTDEKPSIPEDTFRQIKGVDALDSIGVVFATDGTINDVLLGSPAHSAHLGPGMKVMGVNGSSWSENRMNDAIADSVTKKHLELIVVNGDTLETRQVEYDGGTNYLTLVEHKESKNWLKEIVKPRSGQK